VADADSLKKAIESLQEMQGGLGQLSEMMESTQQVSDGLLASFQSFATAGSSSTLWNAVSRFSSGIFPGFWSMQNKIRAVAVYMQYVEKKQKEQIKKEGEIASQINKQTKVRMESANTLAILNKKTQIKEYEMQKLRTDDYFKSLTTRMDNEKALISYKKQFNEEVYQNIQSEIALASGVTQRIKYEEKYQYLFQQAGMSKRKEVTDALYFYEQERDLKESITKLEAESVSYATFQLRNAKGRTIAMTDQQKAKAHADKENIAVQIAEQKLTLEATQASRKFLEEQSGISLAQDIEGGSGVVFEGKAKRKPKSFGQLLGESFSKKFNRIHKIMMAAGMVLAIIKKQKISETLGQALTPLGNFLKNGLMVMGYTLLFIFALGALVFLIIKSGLVDYVLTMGDRFMEAIDKFMPIFELVWDGLSDFFLGIYTFLAGAFGGDGQKLFDGLTLILGGAIKLVVGVALGAFALLGATIWAVLAGTKDWFGGYIDNLKKDFRDNGLSAILNLGMDILILLAVWFAKDMVYKAAGGGIIGGIAVGAMGLIGASMLGSRPFASGGRVNQGGNILVGEAGPEILSVPINSRVTPSVQSKGMTGNNITVNVNGRIGASDSELNEIARKIGQKINREMNKYGSSGYRA